MARSRGVYRAVVDDDHDPETRGRPLVTGAEACLPPMPAALFTLPGPGSSVWVQFEDGDRKRPVWTGVVWETTQVAEQTITSTTALRIRAPRVTVQTGSAEFAGVVKCSTLIADTVIASSYTPGAGNVW
jgi:hypothetical protein